MTHYIQAEYLRFRTPLLQSIAINALRCITIGIHIFTLISIHCYVTVFLAAIHAEYLKPPAGSAHDYCAYIMYTRIINHCVCIDGVDSRDTQIETKSFRESEKSKRFDAQ